MYKTQYDSMMKALRRNPHSFESANILAEIFLLDKNRHRAIEYYEMSLKIKDEQPSAHNRLGELLEFFRET
jgi:Tfp pilus assembly protein PilF